MKISTHDFHTIMFYAYRYAMGRRTYVTQEMSDLLIKYQHDLNWQTQQKIALEIGRRIKNNEAGDDCDVKNWLRVKKEYENDSKI